MPGDPRQVNSLPVLRFGVLVGPSSPSARFFRGGANGSPVLVLGIATSAADPYEIDRRAGLCRVTAARNLGGRPEEQRRRLGDRERLEWLLGSTDVLRTASTLHLTLGHGRVRRDAHHLKSDVSDTVVTVELLDSHLGRIQATVDRQVRAGFNDDGKTVPSC